MKRKIAVIFTGGTISMTINQDTKAATPSLSSGDIMSLVQNIKDIVDLELIDFSAIPGPHMTPEKMMELKAVISEKIAQPDIDGVVVTHGTDNLEETAYLLDLSLNVDKPIVMTGSMRNASELGYDGPSNLASAILTAMDENSYDRGVLVVLNDDINAACEVTKTHTMALDTFKSSGLGPIGIVDSNDVIYYRKQMFKRAIIETNQIEPDVALLKSAAGMDSKILDFLVESKTKGIVIEAMGRGNLPPSMLPGIENAIKNNIPVVLVSRNPRGRVSPSYGYPGGGLTLLNSGVIFASNINGQKARIALMLALTKTNNMEELKQYFN